MTTTEDIAVLFRLTCRTGCSNELPSYENLVYRLREHPSYDEWKDDQEYLAMMNYFRETVKDPVSDYRYRQLLRTILQYLLVEYLDTHPEQPSI